MNNSHAPTRSPAKMRPGVTLIELLVAVSLTVIILGAVNYIFQQSQKLVSLGTGVSELLTNARAVADQFERDADQMIGPNAQGGGFLAIAYNVVAAPVDQEDVVGNFNLAGAALRRLVRDDQLMFIRHRGDLEPITPSQPTNFSGSNLIKTSHVRVWYGHARRTAPTGVDQDFDQTTGNYTYFTGDLGLPDQLGGPVPGTNEIASQWVLGRQALFLEGVFNTMTPIIHIDVTNGFVLPIDWPVTPGWMYSGLGGGSGLNDTPWYYSYSDIINLGIRDIVGTGNGTTELPMLQTGMSDYDYNLRALRLGFVHEGSRPRVSTIPQVNINPADAITQPLNARIIGQQHPLFAVGLSDFAVEFAADMDKDGRIDVDDDPTDSYPSGQIRWYSFYHNDPDLGLRRNPRDPTASDLPFNPYQPVVYRIPGSDVTADYADDFDFTAIPGDEPRRYSDASNTNDEPGPLRLYTGVGTGEDTPGYAYAAAVFRHDDDKPHNNNLESSILSPNTPVKRGIDPNASDWPYLIRIRYRLHDTRNHLREGSIPGQYDDKDNDADGIIDEPDEVAYVSNPSGRWFEKIISVPRP